MRRLPPLNALQIFETVARHRSFSRAADHLRLTQGAVSRQIIALEEYYKFPLFKQGRTLTTQPVQETQAVHRYVVVAPEVSGMPGARVQVQSL
jgi:LysR family glycine cleavage system transcriptional activator